MGAQESTRRVSIDNEEPALITVSSSVVDRLSYKDSSPPKKEVREPSPQARPRSHNRNFDINEFVPAGDQLKYKGLPYVTTREIQKALDEELQKNSDYWEKQLLKQKQAYEKTNKVLEEEYLKASQQMEKYLPKVTEEKRGVDCSEKSQQIVSCLHKNKGQPLVCSNEVQAFSICMDNARRARAV